MEKWQTPQYKKAKAAYDKKRRANMTKEQKERENKDKCAAYARKHRQKHINARIAMNYRSRLRSAMAGHHRSKRTLELLGGSVDDLINHLGSLFRDGMTWDNYGSKGWHIDHIIPCAAFDLTKESELCECFHYTNLQPLWAGENHRKGGRR